MPRWMINCKEHSRLASLGLDQPLSFWDRLFTRVHRLICPPCRHLKKQFDSIRSACRGSLAEFGEDQEDQKVAHTADTLPEDACQRMKAALRDHLHKR
jgi:hypothetical protein